jgi:hypothetical protein
MSSKGDYRLKAGACKSNEEREESDQETAVLQCRGQSQSGDRAVGPVRPNSQVDLVVLESGLNSL